ncbi:MAG TPA: hypothetical protein VGD63_14490 [Steroidobacteraceae bacterium]
MSVTEPGATITSSREPPNRYIAVIEHVMRKSLELTVYILQVQIRLRCIAD